LEGFGLTSEDKYCFPEWEMRELGCSKTVRFKTQEGFAEEWGVLLLYCSLRTNLRRRNNH